MRSRYVLAFVVIAAVMVAWAPGSVAAGHGLVVGSQHTTATEFQSGTLTNTTTSGSGESAFVTLDVEIIEGFEDGDISGYGGDTGAFTVQTSTVSEGTYSLKGEGAGSTKVISDTGTTTEAGNTYTWTQYSATADANGAVILGTQSESGAGSESGYIFEINANFDNIIIYRASDGSYTKLAETSASLPNDEHLTAEVNWATDGDITFTVENAAGSQIAQVSATDTTYSSGGLGFRVFSGDVYFDAVTETYSRGTYENTHAVSQAEQAAVNLSLTNANATITISGDTDGDGSYETVANQTTVTTTGNHTLDISGTDATDWKTNVTFETTSLDATTKLHDESILFTPSAPTGTNTKPSDGTKLSSSSAEFSIDVNDSDFATAQGDEVAGTLYVDGEPAGSDTRTSNGTATVTTTLSEGGDHTYHWELNDSYGESATTATKTVTVPAELRIYNESAPTELVDNATVELRMYANETGTVEVFERNTSDGTIDMSGLPADQPFVVVAEADDYTNRRIFVPSLYETQRIYLLPSSEQTSDTIFSIDDYTGDYPDDDTVLLVQRALNGSYQTVLGDYFGATGEFPAQLAYNQRHTLILYNVETGETRPVGTYTPLTSSTQTVVVTPDGVTTVDGEAPSVLLHPQVRRLPALAGAEISVTVSEGDLEVSSWNASASLENATTNTTLWTYSSTSGPGTQSTTLNLEDHHNSTLVVDVTWNTTDGLSASKSYEIALTKVYGNDQSLLKGIGNLAELSPAGNARAAFTSFLAMLVTVLIIGAIGSIQPSQEIAGFAGILTLTGFAVVGFGITYDVVFVATVGFIAFAGLRRGF